MENNEKSNFKVITMKIAELGEVITNIGKSTKDMQRNISAGEAYHIWNTLVSRYDALNITNIFAGFTKDNDLKMIINDGLHVLNYEVNVLEKLMKEYGIPMPEKPPEQANITQDVNAITDKTIFRDIFHGIRDILKLYIHYFGESPTSHVRETFRSFVRKEMDLFDRFYEYGKLKGYLHETPTFRP